MTPEEQRGANWMLDSIRASLRGYPNAGGDIGVMGEVERIVRERTAKLDSFFREGIAIAFEGGDWSGGEIQDKAEELGLGHYETYDPDKHAALGSFDGDSGDSIFIVDLTN